MRGRRKRKMNRRRLDEREQKKGYKQEDTG